MGRQAVALKLNKVRSHQRERHHLGGCGLPGGLAGRGGVLYFGKIENEYLGAAAKLTTLLAGGEFVVAVALCTLLLLCIHT